jgi:hypothetical protein
MAHTVSEAVPSRGFVNRTLSKPLFFVSLRQFYTLRRGLRLNRTRTADETNRQQFRRSMSELSQHSPSTGSAISERRWRGSAAIAVSALIHLTALSVFAVVRLSADSTATDVILDTSWNGDPAPLVETLNSQPGAFAPATSDDQPIAGVPLAIPGAISPNPRLNGAGGSPAPRASMSKLALTSRVVGAGGGFGLGGDGEGDGVGAGGGGGFFGLKVPDLNVVYVVDCSKSMNHPHPGPAKTRIGRVKMELVKSVQGLTANQRFFIIFFNERAIPMPADRLMEASDSTKLQFLKWMVAARADGHTDPGQALGLALRLKPELIYFLTDGDFRAGIVKDVAAANRGKVKINTIGFGDNDGEPLLKAIAEQNRGTYQFISAEQEEIAEAAAKRQSKTPLDLETR